MPGIALIFARDGAPIDRSRIERMATGLSYRGASQASWLDAGIAMTQIDGRDPRMPATVTSSTDLDYRLVFDGRLDNRNTLAAQLDCAPVNPAGADDARIVLLACRRWGPAAFERMIGDFAGALWNAREREVWLFRDARGMRPMYYRLTPRELRCASDLKTIVRDEPAGIDEGVVAEHLGGAPATVRGTLYSGVSRLPMAHVAVIGEDDARDWQYWTPAIDHAVASRSATERAEQFTSIFDEAVGARCSGVDAVGVMLSGGLDSSTIAATVAKRAGLEWRCITMAQPRPEDDESEYAREVARHFNAPIAIAEAPVVTVDDLAQDAAFSLDVPMPPNGIHGLALRRHAIEIGLPVCLHGLGSDEWFGGSYFQYVDLLRQGSLITLARTLWADRDRPESTVERVRQTAWSLFTPRMKAAVRTVIGRSGFPMWVDADFARRTCLADRLRARELRGPDFPLQSQRATYDEMSTGSYMQGIEMTDRSNAMQGLDERHPYHDRRLIEFSLALPESDRWAAGQYKSIIRRAMAPHLPSAVIARQHSPDANNLMEITLRSLGGRGFFEHLSIAAEGWINTAQLLARWDRLDRDASNGLRVGREAWELWSVAAVELWWRHAIQRSPAGAHEVHTRVS